MSPRESTLTWISLVALPVVAALGLLVSLAPVGLSATDMPMPDLVFLPLAVWLVRRPEAAPLLVIFAIGLAADLLRGGPLGIGALGLLGVSELLRRMADGLVRGPFMIEWLVVGGLFIGLLAFQCIALWLTFSPRPAFGLLWQHAAGTVLLYPLIAFALRPLAGSRGRAAGLRSLA
ncbi:rod shape-determining protein MreD [Paroceanicella profunda]|uniref:Rod shape-determining protein MreD n=1 Tax=Paroceanicella profunda TaxID=2579971 RepID=A0A5B8FG45_9RHOB|nr:rod shape-determining protein MreD [Paroceanicella profunda]QDL90677.1 rod shape-determining protein MreD [Paroceanicella profunda]